ncbi:MAG: hypothetical protein GX569_07510 [Candidatus Riflebacteria bacterium]|nr:hypothetical protein [Candidatus Riflebacteria bacterium]
MIDSLDIRTLSVAMSIIGLILCFCMLYVYATRKTYAGFMQWTTASVLISIAMGLVGSRNLLPDFFSIVVANLLIVSGNSFVSYGLERFTGQRPNKWLFISQSAAAIVLIPCFTYYIPSVDARIVILSAILAVLFGYSGYIVFKHVPVLVKNRNSLLVTSLSILSAWNILRMILTAQGAPIPDLMTASTFHGATLMVFICGYITVIIGLIILNFQKVELDLSAAIDEVRTLRGIVPICTSCKKIKDEKGSWSLVEEYVRAHSHAEFSHGMCPDCMKKFYPDYVDEENDEQIT